MPFKNTFPIMKFDIRCEKVTWLTITKKKLGIKIDVNIDTGEILTPEKIREGGKKNSLKYLFSSLLNSTTKKEPKKFELKKNIARCYKARFKRFRQTSGRCRIPGERFLSFQISYQSCSRYQEVKLYVREAGRIPRRGTSLIAMKEIDCITFLDRKPLKDDNPGYRVSNLSDTLV
jgi:hypothetical protein